MQLEVVFKSVGRMKLPIWGPHNFVCILSSQIEHKEQPRDPKFNKNLSKSEIFSTYSYGVAKRKVKVKHVAKGGGPGRGSASLDISSRKLCQYNYMFLFFVLQLDC